MQDGTPVEKIDESKLNFLDRYQFNKYKKKVKIATKRLKGSIIIIKDAISQVEKLETKSEKEKEDMIYRIKDDIIQSLMMTSDVLDIIDEEGNPETEESLRAKTPEQLLEILEENVEEMERFVKGR